MVDAAITNGSALLAALVHGRRSSGLWNAEADTNKAAAQGAAQQA